MRIATSHQDPFVFSPTCRSSYAPNHHPPVDVGIRPSQAPHPRRSWCMDQHEDRAICRLKRWLNATG